VTAIKLTYLASLLLGVGYLAVGWEYSIGDVEEPGEGIFPLVVGAVFSILSLAGLTKSLAPGENRDPSSEVFPRGSDLRRVIQIAVSLTIFAALFRFVGFNISALALMISMMRILGPWSWLKITLAAAVLVGLSYLLFENLLGVPLPRGSFWS
jgi:putative tricarboxylic transport membrane protein